MNVKIKKLHPNAITPTYGTEGAAAFDLYACTDAEGYPTAVVNTGLAFEIPKGYVGLVFPRSSITTKTTLSLGNCVGVIDSDYRGTVKFQFKNLNHGTGKKYNIGEGWDYSIYAPLMEMVQSGKEIPTVIVKLTEIK